MNRRNFLKGVGLGTVSLALPGCLSKLETAGDTGRLPNIVFIMADDMGYGDLGCYNAESKIPTPNLDRLASEGVRFTDAHSPSAVCTPTRYGVLTGRYCWRSRLKKGVLNGFSQPLIERHQLTVAELLKEHGYRTACIGKWHLGVGWQRKDGQPLSGSRQAKQVDFTKPVTDGPNQHGFDYSFITAACSTVDSPYVFIENGICTAQPTARMVRTGPVTKFGSRPGPMVPGWSNEDVDPTYAKKTAEFIERHQRMRRGKPFFVYLPLSAPHAPWLPPDFAKGKSKEGPRGDLVWLVDWCVGRVLATLETLNLGDNTLVIFTSDNGPRIGAEGHRSAAPWRGYKSHVWEGGHRVPFIARWPGRIKPNTTNDELICLTDLMATCAGIVGQKLPKDAGPDSFNILPVLLDARHDKPLRETLVSHSSKGVFAIRKGPWKLILETKGSGGWVDPRDRTKLAADNPGQLYNLTDDPYETKDLYDEHPDIVRRLTSLLQKMKIQGSSRVLGL
jgi:arylsulfatase A-like enzyme